MKKREVYSRCSTILNKGFTTLISEDRQFIESVLKNHPNYDIKKGSGIKDIIIRKNFYGNNGFYIIRSDGTQTDFSFKECIYPKTKLTKISYACRNAVKDIISCSKVDKNNDVHHHGLDMKQLIMEWIKLNPDLDYSVVSSEDNVLEIYFTNKKTILSFIQYHKDNAILIEVDKDLHKFIHKNKLLNLPIDEVKVIYEKR